MPNPRSSPRLRAYRHVLEANLRREGRLPPRPSATHLLITWRCNLRCKACDAWEHTDEGELDASTWRFIFAQLRSLDVVKIIGGEPFLRQDLGDVLAAIRDEINPFVVQLVTNGTMTDRIVRLVEDQAWPNLHLRVSLDGLAETHDQARGVSGTFEKVMASLEELSRLRRKKRFQLGVNFTLTDSSLPDMDPLVRRCKTLGVDVVAGFRVKPFLRHCNPALVRSQLLGTDQPEHLLRRLQQRDYGARRGFNLLEKAALGTVNRLVFRKHVQGGEALAFRCRELRNLMYLNPRGELITCGLKQDPVGSLAQSGFETVWYSPRAEACRAEVDACPGCMQGAVEILSRVYGGTPLPWR